MKRQIFVAFVVLFVSVFGCSNSSEPEVNDSISSEWLVDELDVTGIFSLFPLSEDPGFTAVSNVNLADNELVGMVNFGSHIRVFPYAFSVQNEIINDTYSGQKYAFSYCPITKSAISFKRRKVFRASGYLYKDNLTPWDEKSESIWSQMLVRGIKGEMKNQRLNTIPVVESRWKTVKDHFPNALVLDGTPSLFNRSKSSTDNDPDGNSNGGGEPPQPGERVFGIIDDFDNVTIFKYSDFGNNNRVDKIIRGKKYIIIGNASKNIINAFQVGHFGDFETLGADEFPFVVKHRNGIKYNILGVGTNGSVLQKPQYAYVALWLAWDNFFDSFNFQE